MNINDYISELESIINSSPIVASYNLSIDRRTSDLVFISGRIDFRDGAALDFKEFIEGSDDNIEKFKYAYNYRKGADNLFRYDNAPDPVAKGIKTFPHHKHLRDGAIIEARQVKLSEVIAEIEEISIAGE